jgi:hypothetical protein
MKKTKKHMVTVASPLPDAFTSQMNAHEGVDWNKIVKNAIQEKLESLALAESLAKGSKLTKKDVEEFSEMITRKAVKRFLS